MKITRMAVVAAAELLWTVATASADYSDALNINLGDGTGVPGSGADVSGTQATPQTPDGLLAGNWNNVITVKQGPYGAWRTSGYGGGGWAGNVSAIYTPRGRVVPVQTNEPAPPTPLTNFYLMFYANNGNLGNGPTTFGGDANTLSYYGYRGRAGYYVELSWANLTAFSNYDVYALIGPNGGIWTNNSWNRLGTFTGDASKVWLTAWSDLKTVDVAALQFLSKDPIPYDGALLLVR